MKRRDPTAGAKPGEGRSRPAETEEAGAPPFPRETLLAVRERSPEALGELFDYAFDRLYSLAFRLLGDEAAAKDAVQGVFLKVHRFAHKIDPDRDPRPWLTTITYNVVRDHWRSAGSGISGKSISLDAHPALVETVPNGGADPEQKLLEAEEAGRVQRALGRLPEDLRTVVLLREYDGRKHDEIAEIVGASAQAVRKRYSRALARLGEILKEEQS